MRAPLSSLFAVLGLWACAAAPNPGSTGSGPANVVVGPQPAAPSEAPAETPAEAAAAAAAGAETSSESGGPPAAEPGDGAQDPPEARDGVTLEPEVHARLTVGTVGGEPIDARDFFERLWMRDSSGAREVFEYLVMSRVALFEAERLGVLIDPASVDATLERAYAALRAKLAESGSELTLEEHIQRTLELDLPSYELKLRADAIVQLLTERCVRAWYLANDRARVRLMEIPDEATLDRARAELADGRAFEDVARDLGVDEGAAEGGTQMTVVRSQTSELSRLAFATEVGEVGGPLVQQEHFLLLRVEERLEAVEGLWDEVGEAVEASLAETEIDADRLEYVQWRSAMMRRYPIDLGPFIDLVRKSAP